MPTIHGAPVSPFVRKVLITLEMKNIAYDIKPLVPFNAPEEFKKLSPLGKIPVYQDDTLTITDSTIICQYLDDIHSTSPILPKDPVDRARALWIEEYMDTKGFEVLVANLFFERVVKPKYLNEATDEALVQQNLKENVPVVLDYLTTLVPENGFIFGDSLTIADIMIGSCFINASYGDFTIDEGKWPTLAAYVLRVTTTEVFKNRITEEQKPAA